MLHKVKSAYNKLTYEALLKWIKKLLPVSTEEVVLIHHPNRAIFGHCKT